MKQTDDPGRRARAIDGLAVALGGVGEAEHLAALWILNATWEVDYDRSIYPELVLPFVRSGNPHLRGAAARALAATGAGAEFLEDVLPLAADREWKVRQSMAHVLIKLSGYRPDEPTSLALVRLLGDSNPQVLMKTLSSLERMRVLHDGVESKLLEMAGSGEEYIRRRSLSALGSLPRKSDRVLEVLLSYLENEDYNERRHAYHGLRENIPETSKRRVARAVVEAIRRRPTHNDLNQCFRILEGCADERDVEAIEEVAANPMLSESVRGSLRRWIESLRRQISR